MKTLLTVNGKSMIHNPITGQCEMFPVEKQKPVTLEQLLIGEIKAARTLDDLDQFKEFFKGAILPALQAGNPKAHERVRGAWLEKRKRLE